MLDGLPKISVLVITYNQEDLIKRAIDSLLAQKDYIYEICVSDDCSKDRTWDILQEYSAKYPGLFVLNRNEPNVGIFENIEKTWTMPTGDIIYQLSGDDECGEGWFKEVVEYIRDNNIDYKNEMFCIYGDYKCIYPNGDSLLFKNDAITSGIDPVRLAIRKYIGNRSSCYSINVLKKFSKVSKGRSYEAEGAQDRLLQLYSEKNYYCPHLGNVYYTGIGVNRHLSPSDIVEVFDKGVKYNQEVLQNLGYPFNSKEIYYMQYYIVKNKFIYQKSISNLFKSLALYIKAFDWTFKMENFRLPIYVFAIRRRLPHKQPIECIVSHNI